MRLGSSSDVYYRGQPKAGTGYKMLSVPFVFSMSRFQGPAFRCDKIVVTVLFLESANRSWQAFLSILVFGGFHVAFVTL